MKAQDRNRERMICHCCHVTVGDVVQAVAEGAADFTAVQKATGVSRSCRRCRADAELVFAAAVEARIRKDTQ